MIPEYDLLFSSSLRKNLAGNAGTREIRHPDLRFAPTNTQKNLVEDNFFSGFGIELFDRNFFSDGNPILFAARFNNCECGHK